MNENETKEQPAEFKDSAGRTWTLRITVADLDPLRRLAQLDLGKVGTDGMRSILSRCADLIQEPELLVRAVYHLCEESARQRQVTPEDFARGFDGDVLRNAGAALWGACVDFFPFPPLSRGEMKAILANALDPQTT